MQQHTPNAAKSRPQGAPAAALASPYTAAPTAAPTSSLFPPFIAASTSTSAAEAAAAAALWVGVAGMVGALVATWPLIESAKAAGGINPLLRADWRRSGLFLGWAVSVLLAAATVTSAACALRYYSRPSGRRGSSSSHGSSIGAVAAARQWATLWAVKVAALVLLTALTTAPGLGRRTPLFFGVGGCALAGMFVVTALLWAAAPGRRTPADCCLLEGYAFFLCAAWFTCGVHTAPGGQQRNRSG